MICLRCGYCCIKYFVPIVVDPEKGLVPDNLTIQCGEGPCIHLRGDEPGSYSCAVHDYEWYMETPCFDFGQVEESPTDLCRLGEYVLRKFKASLKG